MILNRQREVRVTLASLGRFLGRVKSAIGGRRRGADISVCLVSEAEIKRLNRVFRGKPRPTDVLSFPAAAQHAPSGNGRARLRRAEARARSAYLGDIAISPATARRNAADNGRTLEQELRALILHGVLHLMGYDHETDSGEMEKLERRLRRRLRVRS